MFLFSLSLFLSLSFSLSLSLSLSLSPGVGVDVLLSRLPVRVSPEARHCFYIKETRLTEGV